MLERCLDERSGQLEAGPKGDRARNQDMETSYHTSRISKEDPANLFKRSWPSEREVPAKASQVQACFGLQKKPRRLRFSRHSKGCAPRNTKGRKVRSKIRGFTEFCNSHYVSHFAAFFIEARAKRSRGESCID